MVFSTCRGVTLLSSERSCVQFEQGITTFHTRDGEMHWVFRQNRKWRPLIHLQKPVEHGNSGDLHARSPRITPRSWRQLQPRQRSASSHVHDRCGSPQQCGSALTGVCRHFRNQEVKDQRGKQWRPAPLWMRTRGRSFD